jgi:hypothetical protein
MGSGGAGINLTTLKTGDTTGISAGTVAAKFVVLFQQFMLLLHLMRATTGNIT